MEQAGILGNNNSITDSLSQKKIVAVCFFSMALTMGAITNCSGIFVKPMSESLGYSRSALSMIYSLYSIGQVVIALFSGKIFARVKVSSVMRAGSLAAGIGLAVMGLGRSLAVFYIVALLIGLGMGALCMVPVSLLIKSWYKTGYGLALGIAMSGSGLGGMLFSLIFVNGIQQIGWRSCYLITALAQLVILFPMIRLWVKEAPEVNDKNMNRSSAGSEEPVQGMEVRRILKDCRFWLFAAASVVTYASVSTIHQSAAAYLSDLGCSTEQISLITSGGMLSLAVGKIVLGRIYARTNARCGTLVCSACGLAALASMICYRSEFAPYAYIVFFGVGYSFGSITYPIVTEALFGNRSFAGINGIYNAVGSLSLSAGVMVASGIYDLYGDYTIAYKLFFILSVAAMAVYIKLIPKE